MALLYRVVAAGLVCVLAASGTGCTSVKTIRPATEPTASPFGSVKTGDKILLHLKDGRRVQIVVQKIDGDALLSEEGGRYSRSEITQLQRRSFSGGKTALAVAGTVAAALLVVGYLIVSALDFTWY
jgi:hypothetical protein